MWVKYIFIGIYCCFSSI